MGTANEAELGLCFGILPDHRIVVLDTLQFSIVDDIDLCVGGEQGSAQFLCFGGQIFDVVKANCAVAGGGCAEILQICAVFIVELCAQPGFHAGDIRDILHDLHTDGAAQQLCFGFILAFYLDEPGCLTAFVGEQTEMRDTAGNGTHDVHNAGVAVAPGTQNGVGIYHSRGFRPAEDLALLGLIAYLIQVAGAGKGILIQQTQIGQLLFIICLLGVHEILKNEILQEVGGNILVQRPGIHGEFLRGQGSGIDKLLHQIKYRPHHLQTEGSHQVIILGGNRNHLVRTEGFAIHHQGLHDSGHGFALGTVQNGLLFLGK